MIIPRSLFGTCRASRLTQRCVSAVIGLVLAASLREAKGNIFQNGSFESGTVNDTVAFVDPNNATPLNSLPIISNWETSPQAYWVNDATRTPAGGGQRMVWLGPPIGSNTCITQTLALHTVGNPTTQLVGGETYRLSIDYSMFDRLNPTATSGLSSLQIHYVMYDASGIDLSTYTYFPTDPSDPSVPTNITDTLSPWTIGGGSGLDWTTASFDFTLPDVTGYTSIKFCFSAPQNTVDVPSKGVLIDNASLTVVPEPTGIALIWAAGIVLQIRRKRR
jgi:hypothetical protein